jgi:NitT/TauT family transport system permease protein
MAVVSASNPWRNRLPPILAGVGLIALWQGIISGFGIPTYIAPAPLEVLQTFWQQAAILGRNLLPTLMESLAGFVFGNLVAILIAIAFVHSRLAQQAFFPIAVFINTIPILAIAPILVLIFGNGYTPKIVIAALICFFPTLVNMVRGLQAVSPATLDLMRILSASKSEIFWKIRLPSSLPFLFAALKIASTTCVIGAIVGEWIGSDFGLGALIIEATYNFRSPLLFATVFVCAGLAVSLFALMSYAERRLITWKTAEVH